MSLRSSIVVLALALVIGGCGSSAAVRTTFEPVYRAGKALEGAVTTGVTYPKFTELLQTFNTEISIAGDKKPTGKGRNILDHYVSAAEIYADSLALWRRSLHDGQVSDATAAALTTKYWLLGDDHDSKAAVQKVWSSAALPLGIANSLYLAQIS